MLVEVFRAEQIFYLGIPMELRASKLRQTSTNIYSDFNEIALALHRKHVY